MITNLKITKPIYIMLIAVIGYAILYNSYDILKTFSGISSGTEMQKESYLVGYVSILNTIIFIIALAVGGWYVHKFYKQNLTNDQKDS
jgi:hypothetical protein